jgi:hypothetical protein
VTLRRFVLRAGALVVVALALGGPTPGYVGNCDGTGGSGSVDRVQFCTDELGWECARDNARHPDTTVYNACVAQIDRTCAGFNFPAGCAPSHQLAYACISALADAGRVATPTAMIVECQSTTLCGTGAPLTSPEGI